MLSRYQTHIIVRKNRKGTRAWVRATTEATMAVRRFGEAMAGINERLGALSEAGNEQP